MSDSDLPVFNLLLHPRYQLRSGRTGVRYSIDVRIKNGPKSRRKHIQGIQIDFERQPGRRISRSLKPKRRKDKCFQKVLENTLEELEATLDKALRNTWDCISEEDLECLLCRQCLSDPVTTPCGHTFCRDCLTRVLDHRLSCPLCVCQLSVGDYLRGTSEVLEQAIQFLFPELTKPESHHSATTAQIPVFVCTNAFPGVACPLYVNEPRYRLLIRRCLQSATKTFAMASVDPCGAKFMQYGTILEIRDAVTLEDGRIILSTQGARRFRVVSVDEQDGYDTANIEHIHDDRPRQEDISAIVLLHKKVYSRAVKWIRLLSPSVLSEVERLIGKMPLVENDWLNLPDGPSWTWWLIPILPLSSHLQVGFLSSTSLEKRLRAIDKMLEHIKVRMRGVTKEEPLSYPRLEDNSVFCSE